MIMFEDYKELAYRKAIWQKLGHLLQDHFPEDLSVKDAIVCDDVPYKDRVVPREAIEDVLEEIVGIIGEAQRGMESFDMVRREHAGADGEKAQPARGSRKGARRKA